MSTMTVVAVMVMTVAVTTVIVEVRAAVASIVREAWAIAQTSIVAWVVAAVARSTIVAAMASLGLAGGTQSGRTQRSNERQRQ